MADLLRQRGEKMQWYRDELLHMAKELGHRLLPAFNTSSGLPYPKVVTPGHTGHVPSGIIKDTSSTSWKNIFICLCPVDF